jgi:hypothetical protein
MKPLRRGMIAVSRGPRIDPDLAQQRPRAFMIAMAALLTVLPARPYVINRIGLNRFAVIL